MPKVGSEARVVSVDGPTELTVKIGKRTLPVRLHGVDAPRPGECGAEETTLALRGFVRRAPRRLHFGFAMRGKALARDEGGRLLVTLAYPVRKLWRDLGNDLVRTGWAREHEPATLDSPPTRRAETPPGTHTADEALPHVGRGLATACGGLAHLPQGAPIPAWETPVWNVGADGVATSIGPVVLDQTATLTVRELARVVPIEVNRIGRLCWVSAPTVGLLVFLDRAPPRCGDAVVTGFLTDGSRGSQLSRGGGIGASLAKAKAGYPLLDLDDPNLWLSGMDDRRSAWQTTLMVDPNAGGSVTGLMTARAPRGSESAE